MALAVEGEMMELGHKLGRLFLAHRIGGLFLLLAYFLPQLLFFLGIQMSSSSSSGLPETMSFIIER